MLICFGRNHVFLFGMLVFPSPRSTLLSLILLWLPRSKYVNLLRYLSRISIAYKVCSTAAKMPYTAFSILPDASSLYHTVDEYMYLRAPVSKGCDCCGEISGLTADGRRGVSTVRTEYRVTGK